jgi:hypothetical protein
MSASRRGLVAALLVVAASLAAGLPAAHADGDPASDVLLFQDVYLPYDAPSKEVANHLGGVVAAAKERGYDVKVAVIQADADLGSVGVLFGQPQRYAVFLERELRLKPDHLLLVVMPSGYGVAAGGGSKIVNQNGVPTIVRTHTSVKAEQRVLAGLRPPISDEPDAVANSATDAVRALAAQAGVEIPSDVPDVDVGTGTGFIHNPRSGPTTSAPEEGDSSRWPRALAGGLLVLGGIAAAVWALRQRAAGKR